MGDGTCVRFLIATTIAAMGAIAAGACTKASAPGSQPAGELQEARAGTFVDSVEKTLHELSQRLIRAAWVQETYITYDTEALVAQTDNEVTAAVTKFALEGRRYDSATLPPETARKLKLLKLALVAPAPNNDPEREEQAMARGAHGAERRNTDGRHGDHRLLRAFESLVGRGEREERREARLERHVLTPRGRDA